MNAATLRDFDPRRDRLTADVPALFLSASVPARKPFPDDRTKDIQNREWLRRRRPLFIREAVMELCRAAFVRGYTVVFGAHPAISPVVQMVAHEYAARRDRVSIVTFQSAWFRNQIPESTLALVGDSSSEAWMTAAGPSREESLRIMRTQMFGFAAYRGAVFIGGMDGVIEEAALFQQMHPQAPMFALGTTGAASRTLRESGACRGGQHAGPDLLDRETAYALVMTKVFQDLGA